MNVDPHDAGWSRDPGWREAMRNGWMFMIPGVLQFRMRPGARDGMDGLVFLRSIFLGFAGMLVLLAVVVTLLDPPAPDPTASVWAALGLVAFGGVVIFVAIPQLGRRLSCDSLAGQYRTRFFLRLALTESIALVGFVLVFGVGPAWIYYVGAATSLFGFALHAPTEGNLMRDQADLHAQGCERSLIAELRRPQVPPATG